MAARKPCIQCGGEKGPGVGFQLCQSCRDSRTAGKCSKCLGPKPSGRGHKYCAACKPIVHKRHTVKPCVKCGGFAPKAIGHRFCPECEVIEKEATIIRERARKALKRKPCYRCGRPKGPGKRKKLCDKCHAELHSTLRACAACGVKQELGKFKKICEQCRLVSLQRQRERQRANSRLRRLERGDGGRPRTRAARTRRLENQRIRYHLAQGGIKRKTGVKVASTRDKFYRLPAQPLAFALDALIRREEAGNPFSDPDPGSGRAGVVCERVGISVRTLLAWRSGERDGLQWDLADAILTCTDLMWWDVWNENTVSDRELLAKIENLFEGTEALAA